MTYMNLAQQTVEDASAFLRGRRSFHIIHPPSLNRLVGMLMRALYGHFTRSQSNEPVSELIKAFLLVQVYCAYLSYRAEDAEMR